MTHDANTGPAPDNAKAKSFSRAALREKKDNLPSIPRRPPGAPVRATQAQERFWFLSQDEQGSAAYTVQSILALSGEVSITSLNAVVAHLSKAHPIVNMVFVQTEDGLFLEADREARPELAAQNYDNEEQRQAAAAELAQRAFDLETGPLMRADLMSVGGKNHLLVLTLHHAIADEITVAILWRDLAAGYTAAQTDAEPESISSVPLDFADFAYWEGEQRSQHAEELAYWQTRLNDAPTLLSMPTKAARPPIQDHSGAVYSGQVKLDEIPKLVQELGLTQNIVFLSAWALTLAQFSGQDDILISVPVSLRNRPELENIAGPFVNTVIVRLDLEPEQDFRDLLAQTRRRMLEAQDNQSVPFGRVVEAVSPGRSTAHAPLAQTMLAWHGTQDDQTPIFLGCECQFVRSPRDAAQLDLTLDVRPTDEGYVFGVEYATALFSHNQVSDFAGRLLANLKTGVANLDNKIGSFPSQDFCDGSPEAPGFFGQEIPHAHLPFAAEAISLTAARFSTLIAAGRGAEQLSYEALNNRANQMAHYLMQNGVGRGGRIAVRLPRGESMLVAVLAVMKTGAAFVPLNVDAPSDHVRQTLDTCVPDLLIAEAAIGETTLLRMDEALWNDQPESTPKVGIEADDIAYVIHTSGTTGTPKGIEISQGNLRALISAWAAAFSVGPDQIHLQMAAFSFDVCTADLMRALCFGGRLVFANHQELLDGQALADLIETEMVTIADFVPATLDILLSHAERAGTRLEQFETIFCGSDRWTVESARRLRALTGTGTNILHAYGVSECTVDSFFYAVPKSLDDITTLPLGRPVANGSAWVLDSNMQPVIQGVAGELYLGGAGVGRGYIGLKNLTQTAFPDNPFVADERLYRTGDRARVGLDGALELLGRADSQINLRGYRIEPGQIEAQLCRAGASDAVVSLQRGELVAHVTDVDVEKVRKALTGALPAYMVPAVIMQMGQLPLTQNGKIDRRNLPRVALPLDQIRTAPKTALQKTVVSVWAEALGVAQLGLETHFFDRGGHSMLAVRVALKLAGILKLDVRPRDIFAYPVLADFVEFLRDGCKPALSPITRIDRGGLLPLSFSQQQLWLATQVRGANPAYNMPSALMLDGELDDYALRAALDAIVKRHEPLRTLITTRQGDPVQEILAPDQRMDFRFTDLTDVNNAAAMLEQLQLAEVEVPFDLSRKPPVRAHLMRLSEKTHCLLLVSHHIASDGWSTGLFWKEFQENYTAICGGAAPTEHPLSIAFADFASWQRDYLSGDAALVPSTYWQAELETAPEVLDLPTDRPRPVPRDYSGDVIPAELTSDTTAVLAEIGNAQGTTLLASVLAVWALVLTRLSHQDEVVIGLPSANRSQVQTEDMIGFFVNTLAIRVNTAAPSGFSDLVKQVGETLQRAQNHQDYPFEKVVETLNPPRNPAYNPVFQVMLAWEADEGGALELPNLKVSSATMPHTSAKFDLVLALNAKQNQVSGSLEYATALFDQASAKMIWTGFERVAHQVANLPDVQLATISLAETPDMASADGGPSAEPFAPITERFFQQSKRTPNAPALEINGETLDYETLAALAGGLTRKLVMDGVCPGDRVAICLDRSADMIVAVLAVISCGAICVPVDPALPNARRNFIVKDAAPRLALATKERANLFSGLIPTRTPDGAFGDLSAEVVTISASDRCYMLYTSGSTGSPKGVVQTHEMLANLVAWQNGPAVKGAPLPKRVMQFASLGFDVAFQEIFSALTSGATLVLVDDATRQDMSALGRYINAVKPERAFLPFAVLQQLAALELKFDTAMNCEVVTAGEALIITPALCHLLTGLGGAYFYNQYGPTETHVVSQHCLVCADHDQWPERPPIGKPIAGNRIYVLDPAGQALPAGVPGEIYLAGAGVADSYWQQPALSAERFDADPHTSNGARMFKSGDLGFFDAVGNLHFSGRTDQQIKLRGFRVEPAEVEAVILSHAAVSDAVVLAIHDEKGEMALFAYTVGTAAQTELKKYLGDLLPEHMIPQRWLELVSMPLNANGKIDRQALALIEIARDQADFEAPLGAVEITIAAIWSEILHIDPVGRQSDFFLLGGHSLLAARLIHQINTKLGSDLTLSDLLEHPVLQALATCAESRMDSGVSAPQVVILHDPDARFEPFPMTDIQQAYWVGRNADMGLGGVSAHAYEEIKVHGLDVDRLEVVLNKMIARHDMLRTIFRPDGRQQVLDVPPEYVVNIIDLRGMSPAEQTMQLEKTRRQLSHQVLDATQWPLFDFSVTILDDAMSHLHISTDALIVDAASSDLFTWEIARLYTDLDCEMPSVGVSFRDYILSEQAQNNSAQVRSSRDYWWQRLDTLPNGPDLPLVSQSQATGQPHFVRRDKCIRKPEWDQLKAIAKKHSVTPSGLLLAAFSSVLAAWAKTPHFTLSLPLYNRRPVHLDINRVIGDFTSVLLCETDVAAADSFAGLCINLQTQLWRDMDHARISGIEITRERVRRQGVQQTPFPVVFNSTLIGDSSSESPVDNISTAFSGERVHTITQTPQVWIDHTIGEVDGDLFFNWDSIDALFPAGLMDQMFASYLDLLGGLKTNAGWRAPAMQIAPPKPILQSEYCEGLIHTGLAEMAKKHPKNPAVIAPARTLDYQDLNAEARGLAAQMQALGIKAGDMVAVMMQPGWEQVVGVYAVLIAGGVYLPLDPALPKERLSNILGRTDTKLVLVQPGQAQTIDGIKTLSVVAGIIGTPDLVMRKPDDLAYVIFTSGSTGEPKGVMIDHGGAFNTIAEINARIALRPGDRVFALSALNFDLSVYDIFGTLATGAALVMPQADRNRDPLHWLALIKQHGVTIWNSVPALLTMLVETAQAERDNSLRQLRMAMLSGDWIPLGLPDSLRAFAPQVEILAMGGATEASIWSIAYPVTQVGDDWASIPYGRPLKGQGFHVLDEGLNERPVWATGTLYISGRGLALGYWGDEDRSAASFVTHPETGERLYNTGDIGRRLPDGNLEFLGRLDTQVKVQGYRIELGSIEAALEKYPEITAAAARVWESAQGGKYIAGYVVTMSGTLDETGVRTYLEQHLAVYEVPANILLLQALPLSNNGKVDRSKLPEPTASSQSTDFTPCDEDENTILAIVCSILGRETLDPAQNLLSLGATSIDMVRICNAMSAELGQRPALAEFMREPTLATLISFWREHLPEPSDVGPEITPHHDIIDETAEREAFKWAENGLRQFDVKALAVSLPIETKPSAGWIENRAVREYESAPIDLRTIGQLLGGLSYNSSGTGPRYQYASGGGLYPVQTCVLLRSGRVLGTEGGAFGYDPVAHRLVSLGNGAELGGDAYDYFVNRPTFESAAFGIYFVFEENAMTPMYGDHSGQMALIEAGGMGQHLIQAAHPLGLGLCAIGAVQDEAVRAAFSLGPTQSVIYSMLGGALPDVTPPSTDAFEVFEI